MKRYGHWPPELQAITAIAVLVIVASAILRCAAEWLTGGDGKFA
jgi:hypothetical protein